MAGTSAGAVTIGSFEVSRWRDGYGDLPMEFQSAPDGLCGRWSGGVDESDCAGLLHLNCSERLPNVVTIIRIFIAKAIVAN